MRTRPRRLRAVDAGVRRSASQPPQWLFARIMSSATIRSSGAPRRRRRIVTCASGGSPSIDEAVIEAVARLGASAHALRAPRAGRAPRDANDQSSARERHAGQAGGERALVDLVVEHVVAQVGGDGHALGDGAQPQHRAAFGFDVGVQRQHRRRPTRIERERRDPGVGEHRVLEARRIHGRHARARHGVERVCAPSTNAGAAMWMPIVTVSSCQRTENASSISVVLLSSIENACDVGERQLRRVLGRRQLGRRIPRHAEMPAR